MHAHTQYHLKINKTILNFILATLQILADLQYIYLKMSSFQFMLEEFEAYQSSHGYFHPVEDLLKKNQPQRQTQDYFAPLENGSTYENLQGQSGQNNNCEKNIEISQNNELTSKNVIQVSKKARKKYMQMKVGESHDTNDLSSHIGHLIKSSLVQFKTFDDPNEDQLKSMNKFVESKFNLISLKKFLGVKTSFEKGDLNFQQYQNYVQKDQNITNLKVFLQNHIETSSIVKQIYQNKKMSFGKKLILIKYLRTICMFIQDPSELKRWKSFTY